MIIIHHEGDVRSEDGHQADPEGPCGTRSLAARRDAVFAVQAEGSGAQHAQEQEAVQARDHPVCHRLHHGLTNRLGDASRD